MGIAFSSTDNIDLEDIYGITAEKYHENSSELMVNLQNPEVMKKYIHCQDDMKIDGCMEEFPQFLLQHVTLYISVNCAYNQIRSIPSSLPYYIPHLKYLDLSYNCISAIPPSMQFLLHLEVLNLSNNKINIVPRSFFYMKSIKKLDLSHNCIHDMPDNFDSLHLVKLNLSYNSLRKVPKSLGLCKSLEVLIIKGNPLEDIPLDRVKYALDYSKNDIIFHIIPENANVFPRVCSQSSNNQHNPEIAKAKFIQLQNQAVNIGVKIKTPLLPPVNASRLTLELLKDRILGTVYGAAIGNALGLMTDFMDYDDISFYYGSRINDYSETVKDRHRCKYQNGSWTFDFDQLLVLLDSIIQWGGVVDELDFAKRLSDLAKQSNIESLSGIISRAVNYPEFTCDPFGVATVIRDESNAEGFQSDNACLCRTIILGIPHFHNLSEVVSNAARICKSTHHDQISISASVTISVLISLLLQDNYDGVKRDLFNLPEQCGMTFINDSPMREKFSQCIHDKNSEVNFNEDTFHPYHCLSSTYAALRLYLEDNMDFETVIYKIISCGGSTSVKGSVGGAVIGCLTGFSNLPRKWITGLQSSKAKDLNGKLNSLLDIMGIP